MKVFFNLHTPRLITKPDGLESPRDIVETPNGPRFTKRLTLKDITAPKDLLVLSREINDSIIINNNIRVTVVDIRGGKVKIGINAPKNIPVHREEVYDTIQSRELSEEEAARLETTINEQEAPAEEPVSQTEISQTGYVDWSQVDSRGLVLSRKKDESIMIGDSIRIVVVGIRGGKARLGIEAPRDILVQRQEVYKAI